jgi:hypothetical protein
MTQAEGSSALQVVERALVLLDAGDLAGAKDELVAALAAVDDRLARAPTSHALQQARDILYLALQFDAMPDIRELLKPLQFLLTVGTQDCQG